MAKKAEIKKGSITKDLTFGELISKYPKAAPILMQHGMHCIGCHASVYETIEQGCQAHGMSKKDIEDMLKEMNNVAGK